MIPKSGNRFSEEIMLNKKVEQLLEGREGRTVDPMARGFGQRHNRFATEAMREHDLCNRNGLRRRIGPPAALNC
jgi:hypothetical protein